MEKVTIKQFAADNSVSYEAIRQHIKKNADELKEHIEVSGGTKYLDEFAQHFLQSKLRSAPVIVLKDEHFQEVQQLQETIANLNKLVIDLQNKLIESQQNNAETLETRIKYKYLLEEQNRTETILNAKNEELKNVTEQVSELKKELAETSVRLEYSEKDRSSYKKTLFGLYRKTEI